MFTSIVVGIDFSARSLAAARWAAQQLAPRARVNFVHVLPEPAEPSFMQRRLTEIRALMSEVAPALEGGLRNIGTLLAPGRSTVTVRRGDVSEELARAADEDDAEWICLGRRRSRRGGARFGATTAHRLLTRSRTAVLIVPATCDAAPSRMIVALDDHPGRHEVLRMAMHAARTWNADVHALHVLSPALRDLVRSVGRTDLSLDDDDDDDAEAGAREDVHDRLSEEQALFGVTRKWLTEQARGDPSAWCPNPGARWRRRSRAGDPGRRTRITRGSHRTRPREHAARRRLAERALSTRQHDTTCDMGGAVRRAGGAVNANHAIGAASEMVHRCAPWLRGRGRGVIQSQRKCSASSRGQHAQSQERVNMVIAMKASKRGQPGFNLLNGGWSAVMLELAQRTYTALNMAGLMTHGEHASRTGGCMKTAAEPPTNVSQASTA